MIYLSIDLETAGLDWDTMPILEFGAVLEDTNNPLPIDELPRYHAYIKPKRGMITGDVFALDLNMEIISRLKNWRDLKDQYNFIWENELADEFLFWLHSNGVELKTKYEGTDKEFKCCTINVAGKNFNGFDRHFLEKVPGFNKKIRMRTRTIDPSILFVDWKEDDTLPSLDDAKEKAGLNGPVAHTAVEDAIDVIELLRKDYVK